MANDFVADPMNRVKPGDIISVRVISIDEPRGRIGFSMKPQAKKPETQAKDNATHSAGKPVSKATVDNKNANRDKPTRSNDKRQNNDEKRTAPRNKRASAEQQGAKSEASYTSKSNSSKPKDEMPAKIGTLGALLQEAGITKK